MYRIRPAVVLALRNSPLLDLLHIIRANKKVALTVFDKSKLAIPLHTTAISCEGLRLHHPLKKIPSSPFVSSIAKRLNGSLKQEESLHTEPQVFKKLLNVLPSLEKTVELYGKQ